MLCSVKVVPGAAAGLRLPLGCSLEAISLELGGVRVVRVQPLGEEGGRACYCSVVGSTGSMEAEVEAGPGAGLEHRAEVLVSRPGEGEVGLAVRVVVAPATEEDWQILQLNRRRVEREVLEQVRLVAEDQLLRLSVDQLPLVLRVESGEPARSALVLQPMTEMEVRVPDHFQEEEDVGDDGDSGVYSVPEERAPPAASSVPSTSLFSRLTNLLVGNSTEEEQEQQDLLRREHSKVAVRRLLRLQEREERGVQQYTCVVARACLPQGVPAAFLAILTPVPGTSAASSPGSVVVRVRVAEDLEEGTLLAPRSLVVWRALHPTSLVLLESLSYSPGQGTVARQLEVLGSGASSDTGGEPSLWPEGCVMEVGGGLQEVRGGEGRGWQWAPPYTTVTWVRGADKEAKGEIRQSNQEVERWWVPQEEELVVEVWDQVVEECLKFLGEGGARPSHLLVTGPGGSGCTSLAREVAGRLGRSTRSVHSRELQCAALRGRRAEVVRKQLASELGELEQRAPGLLILDGLDLLLSAPEGDAEAPHTSLAAWLAEQLARLLASRVGVVVLATVNDPASLHPLLRPRPGSLPFRRTAALPLPSPHHRCLLLEHLLPTSPAPLLPDNFSSTSEGLTAGDLVTLARRVEARHPSPSPAAVAEELACLVPRARWGHSLRPPAHRSMQDVGGLGKAREVLTQTLLWPSRHPELFQRCGVRLPRGVLLYGAPGTGKTLLAEAMAQEAGLSYIPVKGPELLSKYIGSSEAKVRELFDRAQSAAPCLVFFDEFESLAPRRGQDSTGVTDRVVNQLLTQLDGVEGLEGVWVLAASSRPDLIDPALLRPGRLDRAVECPLPSQEERAAILEVLGRSISLEEGVLLGELASLTEGLSGADLRALLYTAQLEARVEGGGVVSMAHLERAVSQTQTSVTPSEVARYSAIYSTFRGGPVGGVPRQRTTLM